MSVKIVVGKQIDRSQWEDLVKKSSVSTWFQTPVCYDFFESLSFMGAFVFGVEDDGALQGVIVGYVTKEKNIIKQFLTRRAIIVGGPLLSDSISDEAVAFLLKECRNYLQGKAIYIETRNFNSYEQWRAVFEFNGFAYQPHLNFHVDTSSLEVVESNLGKSRKRDIRTSFRDGAEIVENPTKEQVAEYYQILYNLYRTKVKTPLFPFEFFEKLYNQSDARFILIRLSGEIIGGTVCVCGVNCVYEWFVCGKDGLYKNIFPSTLATYSGISYAAKHQYSRFDMMGAGKLDEGYGVRDFKAKFGGKLVEHGRYISVCNLLLYSVGKIGVGILRKI